MEETAFGRYRLIDLLGRGGMGEVWRAFDTGTHRHVAVKVLPAQLAQDPEFEARFRREANLAAGLDSPHIVPIYDYGEIDDRLFVSMRLVKGHDLAAALASGPLAPERAVAIIEQVAKALRAAHSAGLVHRDVKPSNILIDAFDDAYLIDFGIARAVDDTGMTGTGATIGTWAYMAPERFRGEPLGAAVDVYALACVLYECLTGTVPYPGTDVASIASGHLFTASPQPSLIRSGLPPGFDQVIALGLAKDPAQRYPGTYELAVAARSALTTSPLPQSVSPSSPQLPIVPQPLTPPPAAPTTPAPTPTAELPAAAAYRPATLAATAPTQRSQTAEPAGTPAQPTPDASGARPPGQETAPARPRRRLGIELGATAAFIAIVSVIAGIALTGTDDTGATAASTTTTASMAAPAERRYAEQVTLPFTDISPHEIAVDAAGTVYVADFMGERVVMLAAGSREQTVLPFSVVSPTAVAVDSAGTIYVAEGEWDRESVLMLAAGSREPTVLPFTNLSGPQGLAVDAAGTVYMVDYLDSWVVALAAGAREQTVLPFTDLNQPRGVAVDTAGTVYVADTYNNRVVALAAGAREQTVLPFTGLNEPDGVAVDAAGTVYVADTRNHRVVSLAAGSREQTVLPFTGVGAPLGVAVDAAGAVYVANAGGPVVKLPVA